MPKSRIKNFFKKIVERFKSTPKITGGKGQFIYSVKKPQLIGAIKILSHSPKQAPQAYKIVKLNNITFYAKGNRLMKQFHYVVMPI